ncbi:hypothetical protein STEG23_005631 [Scotinomys teguina]
MYNKTTSGGITIPDIKLYYRAVVIKAVWYCHKTDMWTNGIKLKTLTINPHTYENLIFDKEVKTVQWKNEKNIQQMVMDNWMPTGLQIDPYLWLCTKFKSKWIKDLNIKPVTLNLIEEKIGNSLEHTDTGDYFLNIPPVAQTLRTTINKWDLLKLKSFCKAKDTVNKTKRQPIEREKIFTKPTSDRGLISKIYKELKKLDIKITNAPIKKWATS